MDSQTTAFYFLEAQCAPEPPRELVKNEVVPRRCAVGLDSFLHVSFGENAAWPAELWELDATEQPRTTRPRCLPRSGHSVNDSAVGKKPVLKAASRPVWWPCCLQNSASGFPFSPQGPDAVSSPRTVVEPVGRVVAVVPQASCLPPGLVGQPVFSCWSPVSLDHGCSPLTPRDAFPCWEEGLPGSDVLQRSQSGLQLVTLHVAARAGRGRGDVRITALSLALGW